MKNYIMLGLAILLNSSFGLHAASMDEAGKAEIKDLTARLNYQQGQVDLGGGLLTLNLNQGYRYLDPAGAETVLTGIWGNPPSGNEILGMIVPTGFNPVDSNAWCVVVHYEEDGYVKDNDAEKINYDKLLLQMQAAARKSNAQRVKSGYPPIKLVGWATPPHYDKQTHKLYWAKELKFGGEDGENTLNYNLRILGRRGVLVLNTVADMSQLQQIERATPEILSMVDFNPGHRYADFKSGTDKVAAYGLAALVAGGFAAKAGLFKGLFVALLALKKYLIVIVLGLLALFKKLYSRRKSTA